MRKLYLILLASLCAFAGQAQNNASNLKLIYNADNSLSPPYIFPYGALESRVMELADSSIHIFNIDINTWGAWSPGFPEHITKFRFIGPSDIGIDSGLIMSTGRIRSDSLYFGDECMGIAWPAIFNSTGFNPGNAGYGDDHPSRYTQYSDLVALNDGDSIIDAVIVEFDFVAQGNNILLDYVFASEEYPENIIKSPNDQMAIFLSKPGMPGYQNIATVPGTTVPVGISTINPATNAEWYIDNLGDNGQNVIFDGFTTVLTASANVIPCDTYHLRIVVADGARHDEDTTLVVGGPTAMYDSGLFLKAGSLRSTDSLWVTALGGGAADTATPYAIRGCLPGGFRIHRATQSAAPLTISYQLSGTAASGIDFTPLSGSATIPELSAFVDVPVTALAGGGGYKELNMTLISPYNNCAGTAPTTYLGTVTLEIRDALAAEILTADTVICPGCSVQIMVQGDTALQYQWTPATGLSNPNIAMPLATPAASTLYRMQAGYADCPPALDSIMIWVGDVGIEEEAMTSGIRVYPNPFTSYFQLSTEKQFNEVSIKLYDPLGRQLLYSSGNITEINQYLQRHSNDLATGNYFLYVVGDKEQPVVFKLSKIN